jgi:hypothetical protein
MKSIMGTVVALFIIQPSFCNSILWQTLPFSSNPRYFWRLGLSNRKPLPSLFKLFHIESIVPIVQPFKNFSAFYGTRRFITVYTRALHYSKSWARSIQSITSDFISQRSILILSTHIRLVLPNGLFPSRFLTNILNALCQDRDQWRILGAQ